MEFSVIGIFKMFALANSLVIGLLVVAAIKPLLGFGVFSVTYDGWRYGYGSGGWTIQHERTYEVSARGWFPWHHPRSP